MPQNVADQLSSQLIEARNRLNKLIEPLVAQRDALNEAITALAPATTNACRCDECVVLVVQL
jgi:predicted component of type VI protein secretion system